jgi:copper(I)-binding protein
VCLALFTSACAAGKHAPTAEESPAIDGVGAGIGSMLLREVAVAAPPNGISYAKGDAAVLRVVVVNNGQSDDQLTSVTSSAAAGVSEYPSLADAAAVVSASASASFGPSSSAVGTSPTTTPTTSDASSASTSTSASASASASASTHSSAASGAALTPVTVPAGGRMAFGINGTDRVLVLTGLTGTLFPAGTIPVTFTFAKAGSVTVDVPVQITASVSPTGVVVSDTMPSSPGI